MRSTDGPGVRPTYAGWNDVFHIVIIPNYKEPLTILRRTLASLAAQQNTGQIFVVLALEAREQAAPAPRRWKPSSASALPACSRPSPGRIAGRSRRQELERELGRAHRQAPPGRWLGYNLDHLTVTSCDADTVFHPSYFACLTYKFATDPHRFRRFWQSPILLLNNIWECPAALRVGSALAGTHIANLAKRDKGGLPPVHL
ncbi:MAG: hypothetical protein U0531_06010 [Dehalococcoidia bacterium]